MTLGQFNALMSMTAVLPATVGISSFKRLDPRARYLLLVFVVTLVVEITAYILIRNKVSSLFLFGPFVIIESALVFLFYQSVLSIRRPVVIAAFVLVAGITTWEMIAHPGVFSSLSIGVSRILFMVLAVMVMYRYASGTWYSIGLIIINSTMLFYCLSNLVYFIVAARMEDMEVLRFMIRMHSIVNGICNLAFAVGLWKLKQ